MPKKSGHDVICPGCRESYHVTTSSYSPNRDANAGMLKLKDEFKSYGWDEPPPDPTAGYGLLECPNCSAPLAPSGRLEVREKEVKVEPDHIAITSEDKLPPVQVDAAGEIKAFICPFCQREFKKKANLGSHMRVHKDK